MSSWDSPYRSEAAQPSRDELLRHFGMPDTYVPYCCREDSTVQKLCSFFFFFPPAARVDQTCHNGSAVFQLGDVWRAGCSTCTCFEGDRISCVLPACPLLDCNETTIATDECCPVCSSSNVILSTATILRVASSDCTSSAGHVYRDGASWVEGDCNHCVCSGGNTLCSQPSCYLGNCTTFVTPPGACCPACIGELTLATC